MIWIYSPRYRYRYLYSRMGLALPSRRAFFLKSVFKIRTWNFGNVRNSTWGIQRHSGQKQLPRHHAELKFSRTTWAHFPPKVLKMSLTRIEKYSERGYILKNPPGRLLIVTYWTALGVWLTPGGRRFEPTKSPKWPFFSLFFFNTYSLYSSAFSFFFFVLLLLASRFVLRS